MASFMSGMAGNVTAFNTVFTYDIYQSYIRPGARPSLPDGGPHDDGRGRRLHRHRLPGAATTTSTTCCNWCSLRQCAAVRHLPAGHVLEADHRARRLLRPGIAGTLAGGTDPRLTVAEGKGGWITTIYEFPSSMAQNFGSRSPHSDLLRGDHPGQPGDQAETGNGIDGLVYGTSEITTKATSWYKRPVPLAIVVSVAVHSSESEFLVHLIMLDLRVPTGFFFSSSA